MTLYDPAHVGQSDARALKFLVVQSPEHSEQPRGLAHIETHAVVFDKVDLFLDCGLRIWDWRTGGPGD